MIGTRTSSSYTPHVNVDPADRPLILVAPRWEEAKPFLSETLSPNEEIASVFVDAILAAGGLPLQMSITEDIEVIRHYVDIADGIAIPGGPDVNPKRWGDDRPYDPTLCCEIRDSFEFKLVDEVLRAKKPLFTTCRGTQLLNVATGGTLVTATHYLAERGAKDVTAINIIAAPEGIQYVQDHIDPSIAFKVVVCAVDEKLNEKAYIVPGLGDAGDRLYGVID
jgi:gamma-glutamyl-gamma-aminobutyrate hydrolase PuuD